MSDGRIWVKQDPEFSLRLIKQLKRQSKSEVNAVKDSTVDQCKNTFANWKATPEEENDTRESLIPQLLDFECQKKLRMTIRIDKFDDEHCHQPTPSNKHAY